MSYINVSGHYPAINQRNVPRNPVIKVYFDVTLDTTSIDYRVISVHDRLYTTVPGEASHDYTDRGTTDGRANILTFTPTIYLNSNAKYSVYVHKRPDSVISIHDDQLDETYKFTFWTGSGLVDDLHPSYRDKLEADLARAIALEDWAEAARIQSWLDGDPNSGVIYPSPVISGVQRPNLIDNLEVVSTYPTNGQSNVLLDDLRFVKIRFNDTVAASGVAIGNYIGVTMEVQ